MIVLLFLLIQVQDALVFILFLQFDSEESIPQLGHLFRAVILLSDFYLEELHKQKTQGVVFHLFEEQVENVAVPLEQEVLQEPRFLLV
jgi:hypothetical protein